MTKISTAIRKKVKRLERVTNCKCTPFYKIDVDGFVDGAHIHIKVKNRGSLYENYVEENGIVWAAWRKWVKLEAAKPARLPVKRIRKINGAWEAGVIPSPVPIVESCDEFVEINPDYM